MSDGNPARTYYFASLATKDRRPYLSDRHDLVTRAIEGLSRFSGVRIEYYRVLSDHVQLIVGLAGCRMEVGELLRRLKAATVRQAGVELWAAQHYQRSLRDDHAVQRVCDYLRRNPLVERLEWDDL
jgi:REP element-mobilizing transposase RayT